MRLLHTTKLEFEEFFDSQIPVYAILSHRWGEKEISYSDMRKKRAQDGPGLRKINACCALAAQQGFEWVWIDTCCIDKKSSAELSEAINSMYQWYERADICYAYLSDVTWTTMSAENDDMVEEHEPFDSSKGLYSSITASNWFTRGWTLQELLAPTNVSFYDRDWNYIGNKHGLAIDITIATKIAAEHLLHPFLASVAQKLSWVSCRQTSRVEDIAYCMLGLLEVNMPLLYGEGTKAFLRLQQEFIKISNDESIFAWEYMTPLSGMLAEDPKCFANSGNVQQSFDVANLSLPYTMTNQGLEFRLNGEYEKRNFDDFEIIWLPLKCTISTKAADAQYSTVRIRLRTMDSPFRDSRRFGVPRWLRDNCHDLCLTKERPTVKEKSREEMNIYIVQPRLQESFYPTPW